MIIKNAAQDEAVEIDFNPTGSRLVSTNTNDAIIEASMPPSGWNIIPSAIAVEGKKSTNPIWEEMGNTGFYSYNVDIAKEGWGNFVIPHDYKPGGELYLCVHFTTDGTQTRPVKWQLDYSITKANNPVSGNELFPANTVYAEFTTTGTAFLHHTAEIPNTLDLTNAEASSIIHVKVTRVSTSPGPNTTDNVYGLAMNCHYETNQFNTLNRL